MILEIKDYVSSDIENVWEWNPSELEEIYYVFEMEIGYKDQDGGEIFQVVIASPEAIRHYEKNLPSFVPGREYFIVLSYDWNKIIREFKKIVKECSEPTWEKSVGKLTRYFLWEYEDHEFMNEE